MKTYHLITVFFITATAWATCQQSLAFFAKIRDSYVSLVPTIHEENGVKVSTLAHGKECIEIVNFFLLDDVAVTIETATPGFVGIYDGLVVFGLTDKPTHLLLDGTRVVNSRYYSCEVNRASKARENSEENEDVDSMTKERWIFNGPSQIPSTNCVEVELHLSYYNKATGALIQYIPELA